MNETLSMASGTDHRVTQEYPVISPPGLRKGKSWTHAAESPGKNAPIRAEAHVKVFREQVTHKPPLKDHD